jgi:alpha-1,3-rhamnosyltransferase
MLVSIGIPSYNHAEFLPEAIESCLNQTHKEIEIIVVDDNSTDDSLEIARRYERRHPSIIRVFTHPDGLNHGVSATVNLAFSKATGAFHSGLPSDDVYYPEKTEKQLSYLAEHPEAGWVYSKARWFGDRDEIVGEDFSQEPDPVERLIVSGRMWGVTILGRRELWARVGDHDESLVYSDWDFHVRMLAASRAGFIDEPLAGARVHSRNTSLGGEVSKYLEYNVEAMDAISRRPLEPRHRAMAALRCSAYLLALNRAAEARSRMEEAFEIYDVRPDYFARFLRETSVEHHRWALDTLPHEFARRVAEALPYEVV